MERLWLPFSILVQFAFESPKLLGNAKPILGGERIGTPCEVPPEFTYDADGHSEIGLVARAIQVIHDKLGTYLRGVQGVPPFTIKCRRPYTNVRAVEDRWNLRAPSVDCS